MTTEETDDEHAARAIAWMNVVNPGGREGCLRPAVPTAIFVGRPIPEDGRPPGPSLVFAVPVERLRLDHSVAALFFLGLTAAVGADPLRGCTNCN
ncbi:MAG: hypothetical protein ACRDD1_16495 [Planctomycetia bacterium]